MRGNAAPPRVLEDSLGVRSNVLAVDLALGIGDIALHPYDFWHVGEGRVRGAARGVELLARESSDIAFDDETWHDDSGVRGNECGVERGVVDRFGDIGRCTSRRAASLVVALRQAHAREALEHPALSATVAQLAPQRE
jgi:hypothetical protein